VAHIHQALMFLIEVRTVAITCRLNKVGSWDFGPRCI